MSRVLIAGATGYLGRYINKELLKTACTVRALVRKPENMHPDCRYKTEIIHADITQPDSLQGACKNIDVVISTVGITKQRDGFAYMDVDYQANLNLLIEAKKRGVKKFIYVSVLNGEKLRYLKMCEAKERFVEQLRESGLEYCVIRPNGFFSDMAEFHTMATKGRIYLFGDGEYKSNPIHGSDLAEICVRAINNSDREIKIGGPEVLTHNEIAILAFDALEAKPRISYFPNWLRIVTLKAIKLFTPMTVYGPVEFFMTVMAMDMVAPEYGKCSLGQFFRDLEIDGD